MNLYNKILVPIDFSDCSVNALVEANKLAQQHNGNLTLLYVINVNTTPAGDIDEAKEGVQVKLEETCKANGVEAELMIEKGIPAEQICSVIEEKEFSMCIMGTHPRHDIISELIGTVALKVLQHAKAPVLIIPGNMQLQKIHKTVFATDFKKIKDHTVLNYLHDLCVTNQSELLLLNVNESPEAISKKEVEEALDLHNYFFDINHAFFFSKEKDAIKGISNFMKDINADLLAVMPRNHGFFENLFNESFTDRLALYLDVPLFSFHE